MFYKRIAQTMARWNSNIKKQSTIGYFYLLIHHTFTTKNFFSKIEKLESQRKIMTNYLALEMYIQSYVLQRCILDNKKGKSSPVSILIDSQKIFYRILEFPVTLSDVLANRICHSVLNLDSVVK